MRLSRIAKQVWMAYKELSTYNFVLYFKRKLVLKYSVSDEFPQIVLINFMARAMQMLVVWGKQMHLVIILLLG